MLQLAIIFIAIAGMAWNTDPVLRPYLDVVLWFFFALVSFALGVRFDDGLRRWEARRLLTRRPRITR
jgi:hypothetical protein